MNLGTGHTPRSCTGTRTDLAVRSFLHRFGSLSSAPELLVPAQRKQTRLFRGGVERAVTGGAAAPASEHDIHRCAFFKLLLCFVSNLELLPFCFTPFCSVVEL